MTSMRKLSHFQIFLKKGKCSDECDECLRVYDGVPDERVRMFVNNETKY